MTCSLTSLPLSRLLTIRNQLSPLTQPAQSALDQFPGLRTGTRRGHGLEFDDLRQYLPGDDIRHIDWNVTARTGEAHTRLHREEREHTTTVVLDLRPGMFTGSTILKAVKAGELAAAALWQASRSGDRCAAVIFSAHGICASRPASATKGVLDACELIAEEFVKARTIAERGNIGIDSDLINQSPMIIDSLLEWLGRSGRRTGTTLLFSNFEQRSERWLVKLKAAARKQKLIAVLVLDSMETHGLPTGAYHYQTKGSSRRVILNRHSISKVRNQLTKSLESLLAQFSQSHIPVLTILGDDDIEQLLFRLAARQIL